jgi:spore maturation protein CgeB
MRIVLFYHSLVSDWNHGNAHFLRGFATELLAQGHQVKIYEPKNAWSRLNLVSEYGDKPIREFHQAYPHLDSTPYDLQSLDLDSLLEAADLVIVHEWSDHSLVRRIGEHRARTNSYKLLFHDTHHRMITDRASMDAYDLRHFDGVLAYGRVLKNIYDQTGRVSRCWVWHEAADTRIFKPLEGCQREGDVVWVGNWGDDERTQEIFTFLVNPVKSLKLKARVYGVRYPADAQNALAEAGIEYAGWLPNFEVPRVFGAFQATVHVPRRPYARALPGIPTIRPFEAMACGIPLISAPWDDAEHLFRPGRDYLVAHTEREMREQLRAVLNDRLLARELAQNARQTILARHTCKHRVDELLGIYSQLAGSSAQHQYA